MRKKQGILAIAFPVATLALGVAIWVSLRSDEPVYQGKTLSAWLQQLPGKGDDQPGIMWVPLVTGKTSNELAAENALQHIGTNALPVLLRKMHLSQTRFMEAKDRIFAGAREIIYRLGLQHRFIMRTPGRWKSTVQQEHWNTARGFFALGPLAKPAIPELAALLTNRNTCADASYALSGMGSEGLAQLTSVLMTSANLTRSSANFDDWPTACAIWAMGQNPANCAVALPQIASLLQDTNQGFLTRMTAAWSLGRIRADPELAASVLAANLGDTNVIVHSLTEKALKEYGLTNFTAPALVSYLNNPQLYKRMAATNALRLLFPDEATRAGVK